MHPTPDPLRDDQTVDTINEIGKALVAELDLQKLLQAVTDATTRLTGAQFGAFFYNIKDDFGESYALYTLSGVPREAFEKFPMPRNTDVFGPTFRNEGVIRLDDVTADPRYGRNAPHAGMPPGHLPVRSYLAVPVVSRSGEVMGGLFFGHSDPAVFTARQERIVAGVAAQASVAIDNARLYEAAQRANREKDALLASERAARADAERANRMKDEFLSTLSHELRTPLNAILGYAEYLSDSLDDPDEVRDGLAVIERNARVQARIIEDLLDMNRLVSGKLHIDVERVDPAAVLGAAAQTVRPAADGKQIDLRVDLDPAVTHVDADPARLQQIVWNLLSNAIKFTPAGGRVDLTLRRAPSGQDVEIVVADTGPGIPPEFLPHVFERFRQGDATTTRRQGGLGLGLSIARSLAELHGGTLRADSPGANRGAVFTLTLPLTSHAPAHPEPHAEPAPAAPATPPRPRRGRADLPDLNGLRIVVVDDEPDARLLLRKLLENSNALVTAAASAREALDALPNVQPDLLISDIGMPDMDGYGLIRAVRKGGNRLPAIALTAFARAEDRTRAMLAGYQVHLTKPLEPAELLVAVATLTGRTGR
jgi:signal transduction histidine kinase